MFSTLLVSEIQNNLQLTLHRSEHRNSINQALLVDLHKALDQAEQNSACRCIILRGENGIFCTGMDFQEIVRKSTENLEDTLFNSDDYMDFLKRLTSTSKVVISVLEGQVLAGGVGLVAASDIVISNSQTHFSLSEALWGLLPACVLPFLIRRIGFQKSYYMTLTAQTVNAEEAKIMGLIDELTENIDDGLRRLLLRLTRIQSETTKDLKAYFRKLWIITEGMEEMAVAEIKRLISKPQVQTNIKNYVERQQFPWENIQ